MGQGNMAAGVFVGTILMALIGWMPIISILGVLIAGLIAGAITRGGLRGFVAGFMSAILGLIVVGLAYKYSGGAYGGAYGAALATAGYANPVVTNMVIIGILAVFGGLVGGLLVPDEDTAVATATSTTVIKSRNAKVVSTDGEVEVTPEEYPEGEEDSDKKTDESLRILKRRYAKGQITKKEYQRKRKDLEED